MINPPPDLTRLASFVEHVVGGVIASPLRRLSGGIASEVFVVTVAVAGRRQRVVVRLYGPGKGLGPGPPTVTREGDTLEQLEGSPVAVPRLLGIDVTGELAGSPALVMTYLPGRIDLRPKDLSHWTDVLVETLVTIHSLKVDAPPYEPWLDVASIDIPQWTQRPSLWRDAIDLMTTAPTQEAEGFVHGDYQHFNVLWQKSSISGVLDWTGSWKGPPDVDVAHARLNLVCLFDVAAAESFRLRYEALAGRSISAWRDVAELVGCAPRFAVTLRHQIGRRARLDVEGMTSRVEDLLGLALSRA